MARDAIVLTLDWVAAAVRGQVLAGGGAEVMTGVSTDTRRIGRGDLFVALRGPRFNGNAFVTEARARGAGGAVVDATYGGPPWGAMVRVADTTRALQDLAHAVRRASGARVVAITGSVGKTTTKDAIAALAGTCLQVVKNQGNLNNHIGLPLSLLQLRSRPDVAVMELGMNHAGEISRLVEIAEPDVCVWTNVGDAHLGHFASLDAIADAKAEIFDRAHAGTLLVCNADDPRVMARAGRFPGRVVTFGFTERATVRAVDVERRGAAGMRARLVTAAGAVPVETRLLGDGQLSNLLAAAATALELGVPLDRIAGTLPAIAPADRRGVVHRLADGLTLIDDSYNSSPGALTHVLGVLASDPSGARRVAALGEMRELGSSAVPLHRACGRAVARAGTAWLV
ncbi:MAG: UDP-N-acetylmuramoyl-tripeptide--D-alanyl-D-alanine ligase, partial [Acidimicrobiia bacterium]|nr:UDP-N-acetylmuramoyl-tripeptide--D-alanyl-D-alanine ligase [Acidimicrobiia bacterium]